MICRLPLSLTLILSLLVASVVLLHVQAVPLRHVSIVEKRVPPELTIEIPKTKGQTEGKESSYSGSPNIGVSTPEDDPKSKLFKGTWSPNIEVSPPTPGFHAPLFNGDVPTGEVIVGKPADFVAPESPSNKAPASSSSKPPAPKSSDNPRPKPKGPREQRPKGTGDRV